jgi:hypothetical protein
MVVELADLMENELAYMKELLMDLLKGFLME